MKEVWVVTSYDSEDGYINNQVFSNEKSAAIYYLQQKILMLANGSVMSQEEDGDMNDIEKWFCRDAMGLELFIRKEFVIE